MNEAGGFTANGVLYGARRTLPLALSVFAYGAVFGVLARQTGLSLVEVLAMSGLVFAGSAQLIVLELWVAPLPVVTIILTTLVVNLRHLLMGAALRPWFARITGLRAYGSLFFLSDESWALTVRSLTSGNGSPAFLLGSGLVVFVTWLSATAAGHMLGTTLQNPERWALDFAFPAVFIALLVGMWKGTSNLLPWAVAAGVAIVAAQWLPGKWYILLGGLAGSIVGGVADAE